MLWRGRLMLLLLLRRLLLPLVCRVRLLLLLLLPGRSRCHCGDRLQGNAVRRLAGGHERAARKLLKR